MNCYIERKRMYLQWSKSVNIISSPKRYRQTDRLQNERRFKRCVCVYQFDATNGFSFDFDYYSAAKRGKFFFVTNEICTNFGQSLFYQGMFTRSKNLETSVDFGLKICHKHLPTLQIADVGQFNVGRFLVVGRRFHIIASCRQIGLCFRIVRPCKHTFSSRM